jgi:hypothetical protein
VGTPYDETDEMILANFFSAIANIVGKELLGASGRRHTGVSNSFGKDTWDVLCGTLVDVPKPPVLTLPTEDEARNHKKYLSFLLRNANRYTAPVEDIFQELPNPPLGPDGQPVNGLSSFDTWFSDFVCAFRWKPPIYYDLEC